MLTMNQGVTVILTKYHRVTYFTNTTLVSRQVNERLLLVREDDGNTIRFTNGIYSSAHPPDPLPKEKGE